jgi:hypothetical protein
MNLTGTDVSIAECRASGYPVIHHKSRKFDPDTPYLVTISNPAAWNPEGTAITRSSRHEPYLVHDLLTYREIWEKFLKGGKRIKEFCDFKNCPYPEPDGDASFHAMASLAGTVHSYRGLD